MSVYKVPQKELAFIFDEIIHYSDIASLPGFEDAGRDMVDVVLPEAARFFEEIVAPTNPEGDKHPAVLKDGEVITSPGLDPIYRQMVEAGWCCLNGDSRYGGAGFPSVVDLAVQEMLQSANVGFSLLPMLTRGVVHALGLYGTDEQKAVYLEKLISGVWSGTMNLTEPQAGSDLSAVKTKAVFNGDHYLISGQKIYITWGDHACAENIIHLVLARRPDAPEGNQGISLFLVPQFLVNSDGTLGERNDVKPVGVEHKLGIHSSPTCTIAFGDNGGAVGYLVGEENKGWTYAKFLLMNERVGIAGTGRLRTGLGNLMAIHNHLNETAAGSYDGDDVARKHAELSVRLDALEALESRALTAEEGSGESMILPLPLKLLGTHLQQDVADLGVEILGYSAMPRSGYGFGENDSSNEPNYRAKGPGLTSFMLSGRASTIYGGSSEVQRGIMSKFVLGL